MNISKNVVCHALSGPGATTVAPLQNWSFGVSNGGLSANKHRSRILCIPTKVEGWQSSPLTVNTFIINSRE